MMNPLMKVAWRTNLPNDPTNHTEYVKLSAVGDLVVEIYNSVGNDLKVIAIGIEEWDGETTSGRVV